MLHLSKTKYCYAVQCPKLLWLKTYRPELFDESVMDQAALESGSKVGDLAMGLFGDYVEVPYCDDLGKMLTDTNALLDAGTPIIAEASFAYDGLFCSVDILKNLGSGSVELYEVKSSGKIKDIYRHDIAYQTYVLTKLGYQVSKSCLVHINTAYVRQSELDLQELFKIEDLTEQVSAMLPEVEARIRFLEGYMEQREEPVEDIGKQCSGFYGCGYFRYCTRMLPSPNVFDLTGMQQRSKLKNYRTGGSRGFKQG